MSDPGGHDASLWGLYRAEVDTHAGALNQGLVALEQQPGDPATIGAMMRAAHAIKGAARVVRHTLAVDLAHAIEDRLVAARDGRALGADDIQRLFDAVDAIGQLAPEDEAERDRQAAALEQRARAIVCGLNESPPDRAPLAAPPDAATTPPAADVAGEVPNEAHAAGTAADANRPSPAAPPEAVARGSAAVPDEAGPSVRVTAQTLTRLLGLAGETVVATRWLGPHRDRLGRARKQMKEAVHLVEDLSDAAANTADNELRDVVVELHRRLEAFRAELTDVVSSVEAFALRHEGLAERLHREIQAARMRPFGEVVEAFPRIVRDLARDLGKRVELEIDGHATAVDREVADLLEAPLIQAIRNAVDHGIETPGDRVAAGKPETGTIRLTAKHRAGMLRVDVADDGCGVDTDAIRRAIVERGLATRALAEGMDEHDLMQFLFVPAFTTASEVSEISGRGVGLDLAFEAVRSAGGRLEAHNSPGLGFRLRLELPLTLSVLRALVVEVAGEPYAFPLSRLVRVESVESNAIAVSADGRREIAFSWEPPSDLSAESGEAPSAVEYRLPLASAAELLELPGAPAPNDRILVVVIGDEREMVALTVDRIVGERSILVRPLDERLGKVQDVSAAGLTVDGVPILILDAEDLVISSRRVRETRATEPVRTVDEATAARRVLVVDDSATVREVERQVLARAGYLVETAGDGMEAWHAVRNARYDLVIADVDMPRMDGLSLVRHIRQDRRSNRLPVLVLSYKDTDEDRRRANDAGASAFMGKGSFDDNAFLEIVSRLLERRAEPSP